ncbi:carboxypeptidase family protein [Glaciihabitans tibetensis]|uniref:alpha-amylase n=1 Tax=Glaciihabitans tibetensis TaxID=1266600 RepID=A0A2T0VFE3_9MICO|nr:cell wall-binding repeat-containing protein [Glaciihabitans tibetensis]PRY68882.1 carboxypeptidase family protein [Glaciihabitans tibetensis]
MPVSRSFHSQPIAAPDGGLPQRTWLVLLTVLALLAGMFTVASDTSPANAAPVGAVTGTVTGTGGAPVQGIYVTLIKRVGYLLMAPARTDAAGNFSLDISKVESGDYTLGFRDNNTGYISEYWDNAVDQSRATYFSLGGASPIAPKNASLTQGARIGGTVTGEGGAATAGGVSAELYDLATRNQVGYTYSSNGSYEFAGLAAGAYKIVYRPTHPDDTARYGSEYWNDAGNWDEADPVTVGAGEVKSGLDVELNSGAHLSGTVTDERTGAPLSGVKVQITGTDGKVVSGISSVSDNNGYYSLQHALAHDTYTLLFASSEAGPSAGYVAEFWENKRFESTATPIVVDDSSAVVKDAALVLGGSISGTITTASGTAAAGSLLATAYAYDSTTSTWQPQAFDQTGSDGRYTLPGLATGNYRVGFEEYSSGVSLGAGFYGGAVTLEEAADVTVSGTANTPSVDAVVERYLTRLQGADRFEASAAISAKNFEPGIDVAYVASGVNFPDALSGAPVAARAGAPILLVTAGDIPASIKAELERLRPGKIVVLGGVNSVSAAVKTQLGSYTVGDVTRLAGADRFAASAAISAESFEVGVETAYVASGLNFPDALAGAPVAAKDGSPILLVTPGSIPASIATELQRLQPKRIVVLGGVNSVSDAVKAQLDAYSTGTVTRLAGADRFSAAADISAKNFAENVPVAYITSGMNFPDALSSAPVAGRDAAPILLVAPNSIPSSVATELTRLKAARIVILGGANSVTPAVEAQLEQYLRTRYPGM